MMGRFLFAVALWAVATAAHAEFGTVAEQDPFAIVRDGLVEEMRLGAESLDAERRHEATKALDRSLHLAEFAISARGLPGGMDEPLHDAHDAIKAARHSLQIGRPNLAAMRLAEGSRRLAAAPLPDVGEWRIEPGEDLEGLTVLNSRGHILGELDGYGENAAGATVAIVGHGGFVWFGETIVPVPVKLLLGGDAFVVLPSTISPDEFATARLVTGRVRRGPNHRSSPRRSRTRPPSAGAWCCYLSMKRGSCCATSSKVSKASG